MFEIKRGGSRPEDGERYFAKRDPRVEACQSERREARDGACIFVFAMVCPSSACIFRFINPIIGSKNKHKFTSTVPLGDIEAVKRRSDPFSAPFFLWLLGLCQGVEIIRITFIFFFSDCFKTVPSAERVPSSFLVASFFKDMGHDLSVVGHIANDGLGRSR